MFPLGGQDFPKNNEQLEAALRDGLSAWGAPSLQVEVRGPWPALQRLVIDLSGAQVPEFTPPAAADAEEEIITAQEVELIADDLRYETARLNLRAQAQDVPLRFVCDRGNERRLDIIGAAGGEVTITMKKSELERLVQVLAGRAAQPHGVEIERTSLSVSGVDARTMDFSSEIVAQKMFMKTVLRLQGRLEIDQKLNVVFSGLHCQGAGLMGTLACNFLQPYLRRVEDQPFALAALAPGGLRWQDVALEAGEPLRVMARLGPVIC